MACVSAPYFTRLWRAKGRISWDGEMPQNEQRPQDAAWRSTDVRIGCSWGARWLDPSAESNIIDQSRLNLEQVMSSTAVRTELNGSLRPSRKTLGNFLVDTGPGPTGTEDSGVGDFKLSGSAPEIIACWKDDPRMGAG